MKTIHLNENMFDLVTEVLTFGPRMAHDDTIETLYYALLHAFPPGMHKDDKGKFVVRNRKQAKSWVVA